MEPEEEGPKIIYHFQNPTAKLSQDCQGFSLALDSEPDRLYEVDVRFVWDSSLSKADYLKELESSKRLEIKLLKEKYILKKKTAVRDIVAPPSAQSSTTFQKLNALIKGDGVVDISIEGERKIIEGDRVVGTQPSRVLGGVTRKEKYIQDLELKTDKVCLEVAQSTSVAIQQARNQTRLMKVILGEEAKSELALCEDETKRNLQILKNEMAEKDDVRRMNMAELQAKLREDFTKLKQDAYVEDQRIAIDNQVLATEMKNELEKAQEEGQRALQSHDLELKRTDLEQQIAHSEKVDAIIKEEEKVSADLTNKSKQRRDEEMERLNFKLSTIGRQHKEAIQTLNLKAEEAMRKQELQLKLRNAPKGSIFF